MEPQVITLDAAATPEQIDALSRILAASVEGGAAISFMAPMPLAQAARFWRDDVLPEVAAGRRLLFAALHDNKLVGTVQLLTEMPANQPHRCEIAKMIVHPQARRLGVGRCMLTHALGRAKRLGKTLVTLDTRQGDVAERLYTSLGFETAGVVPDYAWDPDGQARHATVYMYRRL